jgi:hypothetical protein
MYINIHGMHCKNVEKYEKQLLLIEKENEEYIYTCIHEYILF